MDWYRLDGSPPRGRGDRLDLCALPRTQQNATEPFTVMIATNFAWLALGLGMGMLLGRVARFAQPSRRARYAAEPATSPADGALESPETDLAAELAQVREQLHQMELAYLMAAEQSQFKGGFLTRTSHELRSPLNGMIGMQQLILADLCDDSAEEREFIQQAHQSSLKMVQVLDRVIDAAKLQHGTSRLTLEPVALQPLLHIVHTLTHLQAQNRTIRLTFAPAPADLWVLADAKRLQQTLVSLIDVTLAHLQEGEVTLTTRVELTRVEPGSHGQIQQAVLDLSQPLTPIQWQADPGSPAAESPSQSPAHGAALPSLSKAAIAQLLETPFPTASFAYLVAQRLLQSMGGSLSVIADSASEGSVLRLTLPSAAVEAPLH
jgi:signal transduction histidine kinase